MMCWNIALLFYTLLFEIVCSAVAHSSHEASGEILTFKNSEYFMNYLKVDEIENFINKLASEYPTLVTVEIIGNTHMDKPLKVVKVGSNTQASKVGLWLDGGMHAREWISIATALYVLNKLVTDYGSTPEIQQMVDRINFYIMPVVNPDGYEFTHSSPNNRLWRKNMRPKPCQGVSCCDGVDLNRNFGVHFSGAQSSGKSCSELYRGPIAFSEPETLAMRDFLTTHLTEMKAYISLHAYAQIWFYPYSNRKKTYPHDVKELKALAQEGAKALHTLYGTKYRVGTAADLLYQAGGTSIDWAKSIGIKYTYGLELRSKKSSSKGGYGFILPPEQIMPTGEETWRGLYVVFKKLANI